MLNDLASVSMTPNVQMNWKGLQQKTGVDCCTYQLGNTTERYKIDKMTEHRNFHNVSHNLYCSEDIMRNKGSWKIRPARIGETARTHHCSRKTLRKETELEPTGADDGLCPNIFSEYNQQDATFLNLFISIRGSTCFRRFFRPSSGAQNCTYSVRYLSDQ